MAFLQYIAGLPPSALSPSEPSLLSISRALVDIAASNVTLNRVFIPVLDTLVLLFEDSDLARLADTSSGKAACVPLALASSVPSLLLTASRCAPVCSVRSIFLTATKDLARIRNIQRVQACMKMWGPRPSFGPLTPRPDPSLARLLQHHRHARDPCVRDGRRQAPADAAQPPLPDRESYGRFSTSPRQPLTSLCTFRQIRSATAEQLYLVLQSMDVDEMDELEETLLSTTWYVPFANRCPHSTPADHPACSRALQDWR